MLASAQTQPGIQRVKSVNCGQKDGDRGEERGVGMKKRRSEERGCVGRKQRPREAFSEHSGN